LRFETEDDLERWLSRAMEHPEEFHLDICELCGKTADGALVFRPPIERHQEFGGTPGKGRAAIVASCNLCRTKPGFEKELEAYLLKSLKPRSANAASPNPSTDPEKSANE
jgi:hypothetical protein